MAQEDRDLKLALRPKTFAEVIGHRAEISSIQTIITSGKLPVAWMLNGIFGTGKTTIAKILAREVQGWDFPADMEPDIKEVNAANWTKIDDMRDLIKEAAYRTMRGKTRVIILDECHKLSNASQNLLLPELEKVDSPTTWIFCTTDPGKMLKGIKDRCTSYTLAGMAAPERKELIERAAAFASYTGDLVPFLAALTRAAIISPRAILKAFSGVVSGQTIEAAVSAASLQDLPEIFDIAFAAVYKPGFGAAAALFKQLDERLKKKSKAADAAPAAAGEELSGTVEPEAEETEGKPEIAATLRIITAGCLRSMVLKGGTQAHLAARALRELVIATPSNPADTGMSYSCTVGALYGVNAILYPNTK